MDKTIKCSTNCFFYHEDDDKKNPYPPICMIMAHKFKSQDCLLIDNGKKKRDCLLFMDDETVFECAANVAIEKAKQEMQKINSQK